jgi:hypothetical protein
MTRREWLIGMAAASQARAVTYTPLLGAACYVWQQQKATVEEALAGTARAGYRRVELTNFFFEGENAERTRAALRANKLELFSMYNGGVMHEPDAAAKMIEKTLSLADVA